MHLWLSDRRSSFPRRSSQMPQVLLRLIVLAVHHAVAMERATVRAQQAPPVQKVTQPIANRAGLPGPRHPARAEAAPGRAATGGPGTGRACPRDHPLRDGGAPRRPHRKRSARRRTAGWASCQQAEEPLQVLPEPGGVQRPHHIDRVDVEALAARQPPQRPPP
jgi:hypothetical protein